MELGEPFQQKHCLVRIQLKLKWWLRITGVYILGGGGNKKFMFGGKHEKEKEKKKKRKEKGKKRK